MKRITMSITLALAIAVSSSVRADFADDFDSYTVGTGLSLPSTPWADSSSPSGYPMKVNAYGWQGSHGINANSPNWHWSSRSTNYNNIRLQHNLTLKAMISSKNGLARHNWMVGNAMQTIQFEMNEANLTLEFGTAAGGWQTANFLKDTWYDFDVRLTNDGSNHWTWVLLRRTWDGVSWGAWSVLGTGSTIAGFAPETVDVGGIWAFDEPGGTSSMDDVSFTGTAILTPCGEAIAEGLGLAGDVNEDCYVNFEDVAAMAQEWAHCFDPTNPDCEAPWEMP